MSDYARVTAFIDRIPAQPQRHVSPAIQTCDLAPFATRCGLQSSVLKGRGVDINEETHELPPYLQSLLKTLTQQPACVTVSYLIHLGLMRSLAQKLGLLEAADALRVRQQIGD